MTITSGDLPRIAAKINHLGELLERHGDRVLTVLDSWRYGAPAANLDPDRRGHRHDDDGHPIPNDPVGNTATRGLDAQAHKLDRFHEILTELDPALNELIVRLHHASGTTPTDLRTQPARPTWRTL